MISLSLSWTNLDMRSILQSFPIHSWKPELQTAYHQIVTLPQFHIVSEKLPSQKENHLSNKPCSGPKVNCPGCMSSLSLWFSACSSQKKNLSPLGCFFHDPFSQCFKRRVTTWPEVGRHMARGCGFGTSIDLCNSARLSMTKSAVSRNDQPPEVRQKATVGHVSFQVAVRWLLAEPPNTPISLSQRFTAFRIGW